MKTQARFLIIGMALLLSIASTVLAQSTVAYWRYDNDSIPLATPPTGVNVGPAPVSGTVNFTDSSSTGVYDGTYSGSTQNAFWSTLVPTSNVYDPINRTAVDNGVSFHYGCNSTDAYATYCEPAGDPLPSAMVEEDFTFETFFWPRQFPDLDYAGNLFEHITFFGDEGAEGSGFELIVRNDPNQSQSLGLLNLGLQITTTAGPGTPSSPMEWTVWSTASFPQQTWYHAATVWDANPTTDTGTLIAYLDYSEVARLTVTLSELGGYGCGPAELVEGDANVGAEHLVDPLNHYVGFVDETRITDQALTIHQFLRDPTTVLPIQNATGTPIGGFTNLAPTVSPGPSSSGVFNVGGQIAPENAEAILPDSTLEQTVTVGEGFTLDRIWLGVTAGDGGDEQQEMLVTLFELSADGQPISDDLLGGTGQFAIAADDLPEDGFLVLDVADVDLQEGRSYGLRLTAQTTLPEGNSLDWLHSEGDYDGGTAYRYGSGDTITDLPDFLFGLEAQTVPEPSTLVLLMASLLLLAVRASLKKK